MLTFWTTHALHHQSLKFGTLFYHKNTQKARSKRGVLTTKNHSKTLIN